MKSHILLCYCISFLAFKYSEIALLLILKIQGTFCVVTVTY